MKIDLGLEACDSKSFVSWAVCLLVGNDYFKYFRKDVPEDVRDAEIKLTINGKEADFREVLESS